MVIEEEIVFFCDLPYIKRLKCLQGDAISDLKSLFKKDEMIRQRISWLSIYNGKVGIGAPSPNIHQAQINLKKDYNKSLSDLHRDLDDLKNQYKYIKKRFRLRVLFNSKKDWNKILKIVRKELPYKKDILPTNLLLKLLNNHICPICNKNLINLNCPNKNCKLRMDNNDNIKIKYLFRNIKNFYININIKEGYGYKNNYFDYIIKIYDLNNKILSSICNKNIHINNIDKQISDIYVYDDIKNFMKNLLIS